MAQNSLSYSDKTVIRSLNEDKLYNQIEEAYGRLTYSYTVHMTQAVRLQKRDRRIKLILLVLSAITTAGFITTILGDTNISVWISGLCSVLLLIFNSYVKDRNLAEEASQYNSVANELWVVREDYISLLTDFDMMDGEIKRQRRDELKERSAEIYKTAPMTDDKSYSKAQKKLKKDEYQFFSREELNQMLPEKLRRNF